MLDFNFAFNPLLLVRPELGLPARARPSTACRSRSRQASSSARCRFRPGPSTGAATMSGDERHAQEDGPGGLASPRRGRGRARPRAADRKHGLPDVLVMAAVATSLCQPSVTTRSSSSSSSPAPSSRSGSPTSTRTHSRRASSAAPASTGRCWCRSRIASSGSSSQRSGRCSRSCSVSSGSSTRARRSGSRSRSASPALFAQGYRYSRAARLGGLATARILVANLVLGAAIVVLKVMIVH